MENTVGTLMLTGWKCIYHLAFFFVVASSPNFSTFCILRCKDTKDSLYLYIIAVILTKIFTVKKLYSPTKYHYNQYC